MNIFRYKTAAVAVVLSLFLSTSCGFFETKAPVNPNSENLVAISKDATAPQIQTLITGLLHRMRQGLFDYYTIMGTMGKELYNYNGTESRWARDLNTGPLENSAFYNRATTDPWLAVRQATTILQAVDNTSKLTEDQKNLAKGIANTIKAHNALMSLNAQYKNGMRIDVTDPQKPGPFVSYEQSLTAIRKWLDDGAAQLDKAGAARFTLSQGWRSGAGVNNAGVDLESPAGFKKFNRALAARVAIYQKDWAAAESYLNGSFLELVATTTALNKGPKHTFAAPPDIFNPLFQRINSTPSAVVMAENKHVEQADSVTIGGVRVIDPRVSSKINVRATARTNGGFGLSSRYEANMVSSNTSPWPVLRNEELVLIYAEAKAQLGKTNEAISAINVIRNAYGFDNYSGATNVDALINEILKQRRYSLWYEGHRWVDMRRYNKLSELPLALPNHKTFEQMARPFPEVQWDELYGG